MEELIPIINKLQEMFIAAGLPLEGMSLPQIVVIGSQSCGKSSVLESLVGKPFLPRGPGVVTRCPIILQLNHQKRSEIDEDDGKEWCVFSKEPSKKFYDFDKVREEIEIQTSKLAGSNMGITEEPIILNVYSPKVVSVTVVDLPGIVKVPIGDQPKDIEKRVFALIKKYIEIPESLILAVSPANTDIAVAEGIKMAQKFDPQGVRTLCVVTKLDLMERGTNATQVLSGELVHMNLGIIGVVNRSHLNIQNNKSIEDALKSEAKFLAKNYPLLAAQNGMPYLAKQLNGLLKKHIKLCLPDLEKRIRGLLKKHEEVIEKLGPELADEDKSIKMIAALRDFCDKYKNLVNGRSTMEESVFGQEIADVILKRFIPKLTSVTPDLSTDKILSALKNAASLEGIVHLEDAFKRLVAKDVLEMKSACTICAVEIKFVLCKAIESALKGQKYPNLTREVGRLAKSLMEDHYKCTEMKIDEHFKILASSVFAKDHGFSTNGFGPLQLENVAPPGIFVNNANPPEANVGYNLLPLTNFGVLASGNEQDKQVQAYIKILTSRYLKVVQNELLNFIPKLVPYYLFYAPVEEMNDTMHKAINSKVERLMVETPEVTRERVKSTQMVKTMQDALEVINGIVEI